ncbi:ATP-dependent helicase [Ureibacillus sp. FSL E2-3493]|uniref:ATP-dependent helicase n=1 Tax=Ureibacillus sp. FSL E2-3493 TaxID=2921367 RepID=UPI003119174F
MNNKLIIDKLLKLHNGDQKQLDVILSDANRLIVEAPAGYGKTKTLISKIAYLILTKQVPVNKKILALTFSVNAAYNMKNEVVNILPTLLANNENLKTSDIEGKVYVSNFHGLCRRILKKYGYLLSKELKNIDQLINIDDSSENNLNKFNINLLEDEKKLVKDISIASKEYKEKYIKENYLQYNNIIKTKYIEKGVISYNSIITLTIELLNKYKNIRSFYTKFFPIIIIDEFQDTNILNWTFIQLLINKESKLVFLGDSLQRIYGFIGAIPNLIDLTLELFDMEYIALEKNYRFENNDEMLLLEKNIRENAKKPINPSIKKDANVNFKLYKNQIDEAFGIVNQIRELQSKNIKCKIAILVKQRGPNINLILEALKYNDIKFFFGLFTDEDQRYIRFHETCLNKFYSIFIEENRSLSKKNIEFYLNEIKKEYNNVSDAMNNSLFKLLHAFLEKIVNEFKGLQNSDKYRIIMDTLMNKSLRQNLDILDDNVIVTTVHGAKGLEWDYVILPDMEKNQFPNYNGLCNRNNCIFGDYCIFSVNENNEVEFLEELSVFYVAVTRAKKEVFFTASQRSFVREDFQPETNISCLLRLPGINIKQTNEKVSV